MRLATIKEKAELFGLPWKIATYHRVRYLREHLKTLAADMDWYETYASGASGANRQVAIMGFWHTLDTFIATGKELRALTQAIKGEERKGDISDEMVAAAREYPIEQVVAFTKGKALAWCHEDSTPSLTYMSKNKVAWCPVCNRYFDAISVLMERDGLNFPQAVKQLTNGG
jgi:hypothetical protein